MAFELHNLLVHIQHNNSQFQLSMVQTALSNAMNYIT